MRLTAISSPATSPVHSQVLFGLHVDGQFTRSSPLAATLYSSTKSMRSNVNAIDAVSSCVVVTLRVGDGCDGVSVVRRRNRKHSDVVTTKKQY